MSVNTLGEMSGMAFPIALKRVASFSERTHRTSMDHLPEKREITFLMGHESTQVNFSKFSFSSNFFIFKKSYRRVSVAHFGNLLFVM